tara:strand:+ start:1279 stop:1491 length:213 start_codon:yes stop_codon:yes gene_type:complete
LNPSGDAQKAARQVIDDAARNSLASPFRSLMASSLNRIPSVQHKSNPDPAAQQTAAPLEAVMQRVDKRRD